MFLAVCLLLATSTTAFQPAAAPSTAAQRSPLFMSTAEEAKKKTTGYVPKWKKKKTLADEAGDMDFSDKGIKGTISVVFKQGDEIKSTMAMPGQLENMSVMNSMEAWSLLVNMENQKRLLSKDSKPSGPPEGKAAIVLTDVQGSTALWEADPKAMRHALNLHDDIIRALRAEHGGYEIDTEGDAFFLAFHSAKDALTFALDLQETLNEADWEDDILAQPEACEEGKHRGLRVRIGIHMGPVKTCRNAVTGRLEYSGATMEKARMVEAMAEGGQIFTTRSTFDAANMTTRIEEHGNDIVRVMPRRSSRGTVSLGLHSRKGSRSQSPCHRKKKKNGLKKSSSSCSMARSKLKKQGSARSVASKRNYRSDADPLALTAC